MKYVEITEFNPETEKNEPYAKAVLNEDGTIAFEGEPDIFPDEIVVPGREQPVTTADGVEYLNALEHEFNSPGAMATGIIEG